MADQHDPYDTRGGALQPWNCVSDRPLPEKWPGVFRWAILAIQNRPNPITGATHNGPSTSDET